MRIINEEYQRMISTDKNGNPFKKKVERKQKEPKEKSNFKRTMDHESLCITIRKLEGPYFTTTESWMRLSEEAILKLGYIPAHNYYTDSVFGKQYIKFIGFEKHPCLRLNSSNELVEASGQETASTLCDYFKSNSQEEFVRAFRARKSTGLGNYKLLMGIAIIVIALIGGYLYMMGRA